MTFRQFASTLAAAALLTGSLTAGAEPANPRRITRMGDVAVVAPMRVAPALLASRIGVVYSNFEKATAPFQTGGFSIYGPLNADGVGKQFVAVPFVSKRDTALTSIAIAVNHEPGSRAQSNVRVALYADASGAPGGLIASWPVDAVADYVDGNVSYPVVTTAQDEAVPLAAGTTYWVAVETAADSDFIGWWAYNAGGAQGHGAQGTVAYWNDYTTTWKPFTSTVPAVAVYGRAR